MRKLNTSDIFACARIVKASGMRDELKKLVLQVTDETNATELGLEGFLILLEAMSECNAEKAVYSALAGPLEMTAEEVKTLDVEELFAQLKTLAKENNLKNFFTYVSGLLGSKALT